MAHHLARALSTYKDIRICPFYHTHTHTHTHAHTCAHAHKHTHALHIHTHATRTHTHTALPSGGKVGDQGDHILRDISVGKVVLLSRVDAGEVDVGVVDEGVAKHIGQLVPVSHA